jgi:hypothetical protein
MNGDCGMVPPDVFTTTDCNSLYFRTRAGQGYPARTDHLFLRAPEGTVGIHKTTLEYVEPEPVRGSRHELSEHYGVQVELRIVPGQP